MAASRRASNRIHLPVICIVALVLSIIGLGFAGYLMWRTHRTITSPNASLMKQLWEANIEIRRAGALTAGDANSCKRLVFNLKPLIKAVGWDVTKPTALENYMRENGLEMVKQWESYIMYELLQPQYMRLITTCAADIPDIVNPT